MPPERPLRAPAGHAALVDAYQLLRRIAQRAEQSEAPSAGKGTDAKVDPALRLLTVSQTEAA